MKLRPIGWAPAGEPGQARKGATVAGWVQAGGSRSGEEPGWGAGQPYGPPTASRPLHGDKMRYLLVALALIASTFFLFHPPGNCLQFHLLGYSGRGELITASLCKVPYPGIYVSPDVVGTRLAESARVAYYVFNRRHGPLDYGFILRIQGPVTYVDGRSADIAIYSAIYSFVEGKRPPLATGRIDDDLYTIDGVAYVREKLSAVAGKPVIIPYANRDEIYGEAAVIPVKNLDELDGVLSSLPS